MKDTVFMVVSRNGFQRACKSDRVDLKAGERIFPVDIEIPDEAFAPPMLPRITMSIPASALSGPIVALVSNDSEKGDPPA